MFYPIAQLTELHEGFRREVEIHGEHLLLIHHKGNTYLIESLCPHAAYSMAQGKLMGNNLRCPVHGYLFDVTTGQCTLSLEGPCRNLKTYPVVDQNGQVGIEMS